MNFNEYEILKSQLKKIFNSAKVNDNDVVVSKPEFDELQHALVYLSNCIYELNTFTGDLCRGELDGPQPSRHNYLVGNLKELHAVLRHLTWQTQQVAEGDYNQRLSFLGDFSVSFNQMIMQLDERERKLRENASYLEKSNDFLRSVMDAHKDWIIVLNNKSGEVVYNNRDKSAKPLVFTPENFSCEKVSTLEGLSEYGTSDTNIYLCKSDNHYYSMSHYPIIWNDEDSEVYYISDITQNRLEQKKLSEMAYVDQLTGTYNRRYCYQQIENLMEVKIPFSLVMVDINALKPVNDNFGHSEGDKYINTVVSCIKQNIWESDLLCRIGGDEFMILLKYCSPENTEQKLKRINGLLHCMSTEDYKMSISYGITYIDENSTMSFKEILDDSDSKMYAYKQRFKKNLEVNA